MVNETEQKLRGGYYTPLDLAAFLARWVREINPKTVLEPSCGDGVFFEAFDQVGGFEKVTITGIELDPEEAKKARTKTRGLENTVVKKADFLEWAIKELDKKNQTFDAVVGNPPFIRYQYLPHEFQTSAEKIFQKLGLPFTKHTNAWVPFVLASIALLRPGGRLAMVIPSEIIHVLHAQSLRTFLGKECHRLVIVDPRELWFEGTLQGAVLLMAEKNRTPSDHAEGLGIYPVIGRDFVDLDPAKVFAAPVPINGKTVAGKWTRALLDVETRNLLDELENHPEVYKFNDIASVDVGIVTGANNFFLVPDDVVNSHHLSKWAHPMFGRSEHCPGVIYNQRQHKENILKGNPTNFIWFQDESVEQNLKAKAYIEYGEEMDLHTRYKTGARNLWYSVPSVYSTKIGMLKRAHGTPRLILNELGAYTTDTVYRIQTNISAKKLVSSFVNPLTALSAELEGRSYGGGVLEMVPSEIEKLLIPLPENTTINLRQLDQSMRSLSTEEVLEKHGREVLNGLGLSKQKQRMLLEGWQKLSNRRQRVSVDVPA